ncbi:MAG: hypothetical protein CMP62_05670 [Flavobacteriales bacterium]|nr:hypothetical protein [Flavobacteriales bacterium]|tara:strand:- start:1107 stop:1709 length:603 start_codon:yes stop_codon:yes gene_type:complete
MNFIHKLKIAAGIKPKKQEDAIERDNLEILTDDKTDVVFAKTLLKNNGNFFYCDTKDDLIKTLQALSKKMNGSVFFCPEEILQKVLNHANIKQSQNPSECGVILSSCEYLIANQGKVMLSSKQLGANMIKNLPKEHVIVAYASQIVKNLNEAMSGINTRYIHEGLPSTITTITSKRDHNENIGDGNIKNLSVLLIEDFKY